MKKLLVLLALLFAFTANAQVDLWGGRTPTQGKTFLVLNNVENTALSTWAGTSSIVTVGTLTGGSTGSGFTVALGSSTITGQVGVANGGSNLSTTTAYSPIISGTTATGTWKADLGPGTTGQVLTSNGAGAYASWQAASGYVKNSITADLNPAVVNNSYVNNKTTTRLVLTLPTSAAVGDRVKLLGGSDVGGWKLGQPASTIIRWSGNSSTAGTGGYIQSNSQYDYIEVECISATNPDWEVIGAQGQLTVN